MDSKGYSQWFPVLVMIAVQFVFATINVLLKKVIVVGLDHLVFITYRLTVSTIFFAPVAFFSERKSETKLTCSVILYLFLSAILGASLTQYLFLLGIQNTSATFSCAFLNMVPVITFIMSLPFGLESVKIKSNGGRAKVIGTIVCVGGATLLTLYKGKPLFNHHSHSQLQNTNESINVESITRVSSILAKTKARSWTSGSLALVAGTILWSSWFLLQSKIGKRYPLQYSSTVIMTFFGAIQSFALSVLIRRDLSLWILKGKLEIFSVLYAGIVGSGFCYVGMSWCVKKRGPVFAAAFSPLVQIIAALFDIPFLHEPLHIGSLVGSGIVVVGLYILLWGKNKELKHSGVGKGDAEDEKNKVEEDLESRPSVVICDPNDQKTLGS